jgi:hypothetical protein
MRRNRCRIGRGRARAVVNPSGVIKLGQSVFYRGLWHLCNHRERANHLAFHRLSLRRFLPRLGSAHAGLFFCPKRASGANAPRFSGL